MPSRDLTLPIGAATAVGVGLFHFSELVYYADTLGDRTFLGLLPGTLTVLVLTGGWGLLAGVLSISLFRGARIPSLPRWILPTLLLAELSVQAWWAATLQDLTLAAALPVLAAACFLRIREADAASGPSAARPPAFAATPSFAPPFAPAAQVVPTPPFVPVRGSETTSPLPGGGVVTGSSVPSEPGASRQSPAVDRPPGDGSTAPAASPGIRLLNPGPSPGAVAAIIAVELGLPVEAVLQRIEQGPVVVFRGATRERLADLRASLSMAGAALGADDAEA